MIVFPRRSRVLWVHIHELSRVQVKVRKSQAPFSLVASAVLPARRHRGVRVPLPDIHAALFSFKNMFCHFIVTAGLSGSRGALSPPPGPPLFALFLSREHVGCELVLAGMESWDPADVGRVLCAVGRTSPPERARSSGPCDGVGRASRGLAGSADAPWDPVCCQGHGCGGRRMWRPGSTTTRATNSLNKLGGAPAPL